jgi:hypothetical protein
MKTHACSPHKMMFGLLLLLLVNVARAQDEHPRITINVPFNFNIGNRSFSAGEYNLKGLEQHTTMLQNQSGRTLTDIASNSIQSTRIPQSNQLIFSCYNQHYFLSQIWEADNNIGRQLVKSRAEIEIAQSVGSPAEQIAVPVHHHRWTAH